MNMSSTPLVSVSAVSISLAHASTGCSEGRSNVALTAHLLHRARDHDFRSHASMQHACEQADLEQPTARADPSASLLDRTCIRLYRHETRHATSRHASARARQMSEAGGATRAAS